MYLRPPNGQRAHRHFLCPALKLCALLLRDATFRCLCHCRSLLCCQALRPDAAAVLEGCGLPGLGAERAVLGRFWAGLPVTMTNNPPPWLLQHTYTHLCSALSLLLHGMDNMQGTHTVYIKSDATLFISGRMYRPSVMESNALYGESCMQIDFTPCNVG